ncbi:MAG: hypothetical protein GXY32_00040 [Ruminococcaceae bacterium]|nr:hypothetical protein [Oscillospiraceae bacterium]
MMIMSSDYTAAEKSKLAALANYDDSGLQQAVAAADSTAAGALLAANLAQQAVTAETTARTAAVETLQMQVDNANTSLENAMLASHYDSNHVVRAAGGIPAYTNIESGSNSNGTYIKYPDGTLICRKNITATNIAAVQWGTSPLYYHAIGAIGSMPCAFVGEYTLSYTIAGSSLVLGGMTGATGAIYALKITNSVLESATANITAIGRWK